jgi:serine/threonine protein phosphatase PrpC
MEPPSTPHPVAPASAPASRRSRSHLFHLDVAAHSDPGLQREDNQDSFLVISPADDAPRPPAQPVVLAVCDGMGGAAGGDVASHIAVDVLREVMATGDAPATADALGRLLRHGVEEAARRVHAAAAATRALRGMGTTATACAISGETLFIAQVGDSRAYLLRDDELTQLTRDQTLATLMLERGQLQPEDLPTFPLGHVILQAVGTSERVEVDLTRVRVARGDVILVCSDGLHGPVSSETIRATLAEAASASDACASLIGLAIEAGGPDNVTAIVARVTGDSLQLPSGPPVPEKATFDADDTAEMTAQPDPAGDAEERRASSEPGAQGQSPHGDLRVAGVMARLAALFRRRDRARRS